MNRIFALLMSGILLAVAAAGQAPKRIAIRAGRLIDGKSEKPLENPLILVEGDRIVSVTVHGNAPAGVQVIDLGNATVLPGFIDAHTHLLLHGDTLDYSWELKMPTGVQYVDGVDGARKAVREQVMYGADWIKYYSDGRVRFDADGRLHSRVIFTDEEARAIVDESHRLGRKVAAHAIGSDGIAAALRAGVDTIEHGDGLTDELMDEMVRKGVYWVPTITVDRNLAAGSTDEFWKKTFNLQRENFSKAIQKRVKIALGTDAGGFDWKKVNQAKEFEYYVEYGMTPMQAIRTGTSVAAELLGWSETAGTVEAGKWADLVAVGGDPLKDITELQNVKFVMKSGAIFKDELRK